MSVVTPAVLLQNNEVLVAMGDGKNIRNTIVRALGALTIAMAVVIVNFIIINNVPTTVIINLVTTGTFSGPWTFSLVAFLTGIGAWVFAVASLARWATRKESTTGEGGMRGVKVSVFKATTGLMVLSMVLSGVTMAFILIAHIVGSDQDWYTNPPPHATPRTTIPPTVITTWILTFLFSGIALILSMGALISIVDHAGWKLYRRDSKAFNSGGTVNARGMAAFAAAMRGATGSGPTANQLDEVKRQLLSKQRTY